MTLTTVKVRNWDNTITTVPPYALVSDSFQNWRGMRESGGRRVKRSINIDMNTVHFCTLEQMKTFEKQAWMSDFEKTGKEEVNLYVFRHYLEYYLRHNPRVNTELILMVRQLQPTPQGLPIELISSLPIKTGFHTNACKQRSLTICWLCFPNSD